MLLSFTWKAILWYQGHILAWYQFCLSYQYWCKSVVSIYFAADLSLYLLSLQRLVVKPDQLIKRRGKLGLVGINLDLQGVRDWLQARLMRETTVSWVCLSENLDHKLHHLWDNKMWSRKSVWSKRSKHVLSVWEKMFQIFLTNDPVFFFALCICPLQW